MPDQPLNTVLFNLMTTQKNRVQGVDNFKVHTKQEEGSALVEVTITFTVKDGSKVPKDANTPG